MKKKRAFTTVLLVLVFLGGLSILLYPAISNYWNSLVQTRVVNDYTHRVSQMAPVDRAALLDAAASYNKQLASQSDRFVLTADQMTQYNSILNVSGNGVMGILSIPKIRVRLPIYHGSDPTVLQVGLGHLPGSSFPIGGPGAHAVISGHRGLPSAELLSNINRLVTGDYFQITVLGKTMTYQVDQIKVVLPENMRDLAIEPGQDLVTLVTCTPYGVNSHRLLVRGRRVYNRAQDLSAQTPLIDTGTVMRIAIVAFMVIAISLSAFLQRRKQKKNNKHDRHNKHERHNKHDKLVVRAGPEK